jgi:hypothetical protein
MGNAIVDAYGNIMLGDDAGKSAKLVFVARPRIIYSNNNSNNGDDSNMNGSTSTKTG